MNHKIVSLQTLADQAVEWKKQGKTAVSTSGCFDILHAGHVRYLNEAKQRGDILVVMLNSDQSVRNLKGQDRPIVREQERAEVLAGLAAVDYVCIFDEQTPCALIQKIQPDYIVKGGDYSGQHIPEMDVAASYGGTVVYAGLSEGCSTTDIIKRIEDIYSRRKEEEGAGL